jgi:hypothetical protein
VQIVMMKRSGVLFLAGLACACGRSLPGPGGCGLIVVPQNQWECAARLPVVTRLRGGADEDDVDDLDELDTELEAADEGGSIRSGHA